MVKLYKRYIKPVLETEDDLTGEIVREDIETPSIWYPEEKEEELRKKYGYYKALCNDDYGKILFEEFYEEHVPEEPKHENLKIPKCCGECDSMKSMRGLFGDPFFYCGSPVNLSKDPMQDISTARVGLFSRPEWCPLVKTQKALDEMPPEKREKADMMMRGLKAMFGVEGD